MWTRLRAAQGPEFHRLYFWKYQSMSKIEASPVERVKGHTSGVGTHRIAFCKHLLLALRSQGEGCEVPWCGGSAQSVPFPDGRWIWSTLRLGFYCLPGSSMLQSSSCHTHHKAISDLCWILATIVINKINSLEKKKKKSRSVHGSMVDVISLRECKNGCLFCSKIVFCRAAVLRGCGMQRLYLAVLPIIRDQKLPGKTPFFLLCRIIIISLNKYIYI